MDIDYRSLYVEDYFGHDAGAASFPPHFPEAFASIVRDVGGSLVVDVGAGNNELVRRLRAFGLVGFSLDLRGDEARSVVPFDLTDPDPAQRGPVRERITRLVPGGSHVTCCLDVLEHIDRQDLADAVWNLRELSAVWLLVSVSTRPSSRDNLYHASILPKRTWRSLFTAAGLHVESHPRLDDLPECREYPDTEDCWSVNQWRRVDPFRDARDPESYYLLLRRDPARMDRQRFKVAAARILGIGSRRSVVPREGTHLAFLVGHYQDFMNLAPYWEALPRGRFTVFVTDDVLRVIGERRVKVMHAWMRCRGIRVVTARSIDDLRWDDLPGPRQALVCSSESTASASHMINSAFVLEARARGIRTFQLQHGIWPHAGFARPARFAAEYLLAWSEEFRRGFGEGDGDPEGNRFIVSGGVKFDDYAERRPVALTDLLGDWVEGYQRSILVATNLNWPLHHRGAQVMPQIIATAREMPDTVFLCKLHPVHDLDQNPSEPLPPNLLILDEFACLFAGLKTSQLVLACDALVCTVSTIALEAALARRPFAVLETENPNRYVGMNYVPIASMTEIVRNLLAGKSGEADEAFRSHYYDESRLGGSLERVLGIVESALDDPAPPPPISPTFLRDFSRTFVEYLMAINPGRVADLDRELASNQARIAELAYALDDWHARALETRDQLSKAEAAHSAAESVLRDRSAAIGKRFRIDGPHNLATQIDALCQELERARDEIRAMKDRAAPYEDLGPASIRLARRLRDLSRRFPGLAAAYKAISKR